MNRSLRTLGRKPSRDPLSDEVEKLRRDNAELKRRLEQAELIIDVQKKLSSILGILKSPVLGESTL